MANRTYYGNTHSENGWPIVDGGSIKTTFLPDMNNVRIELREGDVTTVLVAWMIWYHRNVERIDIYQPRDEWGFSWENNPRNSNHLSGTAVDINATQYPMYKYRLTNDQVRTINTGLSLFENNIYHGRNWSGSLDEMHYQINGYNPNKLKAFAQRLKDGYLDIYKPADPNSFPLPIGWYYGPLDGPNESVSGKWSGDPQAYRDGLKRWQAKVGIAQTGVWDDATRDKCKALQRQMGWQLNGQENGYLYRGEWDAVIRDNVVINDGGTAPVTPPPVLERGFKFADVSQYQPHVDNSYPYEVLSFRSNSGSTQDTKFAENYRRALDMSARGKLKAIIVYYFFRPGQQNCDLWRKNVTIDGKIPENVICMVDVEGAPTAQGIRTITGNHSVEINSEVDRLRQWLGSDRRVIGYHNQVSDPDLWPNKPAGGIRMIVPRYNNDPNNPPEYVGRIGHQYSDKVNTPPFGPCDINYVNLTMDEFLDQVGVVVKGKPEEPTPPPVTPPEETPGVCVMPGNGVTEFKKIITGPGHTDRFGFLSTDLGIARKTPSGRTLVVFGDSFRGQGVGNGEWMSPISLFTTTRDINEGIEWATAGGSDPARVTQLLPYIHNVGFSTVLPTDVITIGDKMYMHVMVCQGLSNILWTELHVSTDDGQTWTHTGVKWDGQHLNGYFKMLTFENPGDGYVYVLSTGWRDRGIVMQRVREDRFTDKAAWEPWGWDGSAWGWGIPCTPVLDGPEHVVGEMSLRKVGNDMVLSYFDAARYCITVRVVPSMVSNWYTADVYVPVVGGKWQGAPAPTLAVDNPATGVVAQLYGGYIVPGSTPESLHLIVSQWNTDTNWPYQSMQFKMNVERKNP